MWHCSQSHICAEATVTLPSVPCDVIVMPDADSGAKAWLSSATCVQAKLCSRHGIPHIINNAYGVQSAALCQLVTSACRRGRVDAFIQSTDKNFMVGPVTASASA